MSPASTNGQARPDFFEAARAAIQELGHYMEADLPLGEEHDLPRLANGVHGSLQGSDVMLPRMGSQGQLSRAHSIETPLDVPEPSFPAWLTASHAAPSSDTQLSSKSTPGQGRAGRESGAQESSLLSKQLAQPTSTGDASSVPSKHYLQSMSEKHRPSKAKTNAGNPTKKRSVSVLSDTTSSSDDNMSGLAMTAVQALKRERGPTTKAKGTKRMSKAGEDEDVFLWDGGDGDRCYKNAAGHVVCPPVVKVIVCNCEQHHWVQYEGRPGLFKNKTKPKRSEILDADEREPCVRKAKPAAVADANTKRRRLDPSAFGHSRSSASIASGYITAASPTQTMPRPRSPAQAFPPMASTPSPQAAAANAPTQNADSVGGHTDLVAGQIVDAKTIQSMKSLGYRFDFFAPGRSQVRPQAQSAAATSSTSNATLDSIIGRIVDTATMRQLSKSVTGATFKRLGMGQWQELPRTVATPTSTPAAPTSISDVIATADARGEMQAQQ